MELSFRIVAVLIILLVLLSYYFSHKKSFRFVALSLLHSSNKSLVGWPAERTVHCRWSFLNYTPSHWEELWYNNIDKFQQNVCEKLSNLENLNRSIRVIQRLVELQRFGRSQTSSERQPSDVLFSRMFYRQECVSSHPSISVESVNVSHLIEPLVGLLRDPLSICPRLDVRFIPTNVYEGATVQSKRCILLSVSAPFYIHSSHRQLAYSEKTRNYGNITDGNLLPWMYQRLMSNSATNTEFDAQCPKVVLFDFGSAYFGAWYNDATAASSSWFYEYYKRFNVTFHRIIAFEQSPLDQKTVWTQLPDDVLPIYTLINVGVTASGKLNPWTVLQASAHAHDHVIVKLDIDTPVLENALVNQILTDPKIHSLIDELCFEHHVTVKDMIPHWGSPGGTLKDSYILFRKLREIGIRMHAWP